MRNSSWSAKMFAFRKQSQNSDFGPKIRSKIWWNRGFLVLHFFFSYPRMNFVSFLAWFQISSAAAPTIHVASVASGISLQSKGIGSCWFLFIIIRVRDPASVVGHVHQVDVGGAGVRHFGEVYFHVHGLLYTQLALVRVEEGLGWVVGWFCGKIQARYLLVRRNLRKISTKPS